MQHSSITLEVYLRKVWKLLLPRLHHSDDIRVKSYVRIILGHPIGGTRNIHSRVGIGETGSLSAIFSQIGFGGHTFNNWRLILPWSVT